MIRDLFIRIRYGKGVMDDINVLRYSDDEHDRRYALYKISQHRRMTPSFIRRNIYKYLYQEEIEMYENTSYSY